MKNKAAQELGRLGGLVGGKSTSKAKQSASRENGKKGGRPKGSKNKPKEKTDEVRGHSYFEKIITDLKNFDKQTPPKEKKDE